MLRIDIGCTESRLKIERLERSEDVLAMTMVEGGLRGGG
jgi:hypothetical protein